MKQLNFRSLAIVLLIGLLLAATAVANATTCTVTSNLDKFDIVEGEFINLTPGGLRELLADTRCDTITFDGDYIIRLAYTLSIDRNVTIDGVGHAVTISGDTYGVFRIDAEVTPTVALQNITVTKGHNGENGGGGGIKNVGGDLTVSNCTVSDNRESTGDGSSGGGGIWNYGKLEVINSTFSGNSTTMRGGAIYNAYGTLTVTNSTFSGNKAGYEGGAIHNSGGVVTVRNSIVAQGIPCDIEDGQYQCKNCSGTIGGADNLVDDNTCGGSFTYSSSINLGALDNYGGSTQTIPLLAGSSAIDTGADYGVTTDQRGVSRPQGAGYDIGAYEADTTPPVLTVPTNTVVEATGPTGAVWTFVPTPSALDGVDGPLPATCSPASGSTFPIGSTTVTCTATDAAGNTGSASFTVTVEDTAPIKVTATPYSIWPPNKKMVPVAVKVTATSGPAPNAKIVSVACNETIAASDVKITGLLTLNLRADRNGNGSGRVYTINVSYGSGSTATVQVKVPHDQGK